MLGVILCASLPAVLCLAAHYYPWRHWFRRGRLPRLLAYSFGVLAILLPATLAAWWSAQTVAQAIALLWLAVGSAAFGTIIPWWHDEQRRRENELNDELDKAEAEAYE